MGMTYIKPAPHVSARMSQIKSRGTGTERAMEKILREMSLKFDRQPKVVGHPDFRVRGTRVLVFCDSSFWHGRWSKDVSGKSFRRNRSFWTEKLQRNRRRDARVSRLLRSNGWSVYRFWDTDILR